MNRTNVENIAMHHLSKMNADMWDGNGTKPKNFDSRIITYQLSEGMALDISFEEVEDPDSREKEWEHYCELRDEASGDFLHGYHGYGIDSILNLADTIDDICSGYELLNPLAI